MDQQALSVSQFFNVVNETLSFAFPQITIEGEVSSFKVNQGKFVFFDLKDEANVLGCFMMARQLEMPLEDGMKVRVTGSAKVTKYSKFSLTVRSVELAGEGELKRAMELLKRKLTAEGLFDPARKRPLPRFPQTLGLITSGASAAYADFIKILGARWGGLDIQLADIAVQGKEAPSQIVGAIEYFNQLARPVDVLVIIRGGGSLEDLMAFSTEPVARAVASSRTPTLVGVGHEVDFSLADYAADVRAATPTDAARLVVPDRQEITASLTHHESHLRNLVESHLRELANRVDQATTRIEAYLQAPKQSLEACTRKLERSLEQLSGQVVWLDTRREQLVTRLGNFSRLIIDPAHQRLDLLQKIIASYSPQAVLDRGYAIVRHDGKLVASATQLKASDRIMIQLAHDQIDAEVRS